MKKIILFFSFPFLTFFFLSCDNFEGDQTIPAYIHVESIDVLPTQEIPESQNSDFRTSNIQSVDIIINDGVTEKSVGVFDLPCTIPVLKQGQLRVKIKPVIKQNGMALSRVPYQYYNIIDTTVEFIPGNTVPLGILHTKYTTATDFKLEGKIENFESPSHCLDSITTTCIDNGVVKWGTSCGSLDVSGLQQLITKTKKIITIDPYGNLYLEIDYSTNIPMRVGLIACSNEVETNAIMAMELNSTGGTWKKVYIVLSRILPQMDYPSDVKVVFQGLNESSMQGAKIYIDNIKLITDKY